jgi:hypothetical protein
VAYQAGIHTVERPTLQFSGYAVWLRQHTEPHSPLGARALTYWNKTLDDSAAVLQPPADMSRPRNPNYTRLKRHLVLSKAQNLAVHRLRVQVHCDTAVTTL